MLAPLPIYIYIYVCVYISLFFIHIILIGVMSLIETFYTTHNILSVRWGLDCNVTGTPPTAEELMTVKTRAVRRSTKTRGSVTGTKTKRTRKPRSLIKKPKKPSYAEWLRYESQELFEELEGVALSCFDIHRDEVQLLLDECDRRGVEYWGVISQHKEKRGAKMIFTEEPPDGVERVFVGRKYAFNTLLKPHPLAVHEWSKIKV